MSHALSAKFRDRDWEVLLQSIERGNCIPLLGPDLSTSPGDGSTRNLAIELSRELAEILLEEKNYPVPDQTKLSLVAQIFQNQLSRDELEVEVRRFYDKHREALDACGDPTFRCLAELPFSLLVTSRHDDTLNHFLRRQDKRPRVESYHFKGDRRDILGYLGTVDEPLVYQLYGASDVPGSLAITENDQLEFLKSVTAECPKLPADLTNQFSGKNFLFLGFGLGNYHLRVLMHVLKLNESAKSFALENAPPTETQEHFDALFDDSVLFYGELGYHSLTLLDTRLEDFIQELHRRWMERHPTGHPASNAISSSSDVAAGPDAPTVFISYVKEDQERARALVERLREEGLDPWIDTEGLRFGTRWNDTLEDTITRDVDYFVVLQSRALSDRVESYVHKEVQLALERQCMRAGRFIFPVQIDEDAERLDALERAKIQTGTLFDWRADVSALAREIRREHARRKRG